MQELPFEKPPHRPDKSSKAFHLHILWLASKVLYLQLAPLRLVVSTLEHPSTLTSIEPDRRKPSNTSKTATMPPIDSSTRNMQAAPIYGIKQDPNLPKRWSNLVAGRQSTHPDVGTVKAAAAIRALEIPELCENILEFLPTKDVLRAYRICRKINDIITGSSKL